MGITGCAGSVLRNPANCTPHLLNSIVLVGEPDERAVQCLCLPQQDTPFSCRYMFKQTINDIISSLNK